ncbi:hypothetical protein HPB50_015311 [Hyalomma asiaticum]|uniref:Uncharacterized protein n=1 Tax=Hyalomma asiaticum TaxID=266040 RepID=A0ACB7TGW4_HYAAI|nr:hypothetical protein HPB50_015311 [Hyalomma asiaticum]
MPERVYLGFTCHPVEEYLGPARRCYNCQRYGHLANNCNGTRRCKICAEGHHHKDSKSINLNVRIATVPTLHYFLDAHKTKRPLFNTDMTSSMVASSSVERLNRI